MRSLSHFYGSEASGILDMAVPMSTIYIHSGLNLLLAQSFRASSAPTPLGQERGISKISHVQDLHFSTKYTRAHVCVQMRHHTQWRSQSALVCYQTSSGHWNLVIRLGSKCLYHWAILPPWSHTLFWPQALYPLDIPKKWNTFLRMTGSHCVITSRGQNPELSPTGLKRLSVRSCCFPRDREKLVEM